MQAPRDEGEQGRGKPARDGRGPEIPDSPGGYGKNRPEQEPDNRKPGEGRPDLLLRNPVTGGDGENGQELDGGQEAPDVNPPTLSGSAGSPSGRKRAFREGRSREAGPLHPPGRRG